MSHYYQLTAIERGRIESFIQLGLSFRQIATRLNRSVSTISREVHRCAKEYKALSAHKDYLKRRQACHRHRIFEDKALCRAVLSAIQDNHWSPEQIVGNYQRIKGSSPCSFVTIYREIYRHNLGFPKNHGARGIARKLRHRGKTRHKKGYVEKRGKIPISHKLAERPTEANTRSRIGDWELDTVVGRDGGDVLVTMIDRRSRLLLAQRASGRKALPVLETLKAMFAKIPHQILATITPDRGKEFRCHRDLTNEYNVEFYFPNPHTPWARGSNENTNGLIREYIPKGTDIATISDDEINQMVWQINTRPRKMFDWKSALEVFWSEMFHLD
ncbi:IS30 family transposase [Lacticaseibacillus nasuensis]|uniref:Integrase catalytic region n=1 Tax=Lacticaseibacillus nasuensis JCM 17158 TaxID=1291734 RepID=A0A0R1JZI5_9LACO|nr:IS30 family transposase [Lacticaseibacillus nasuensis]KRK73234.1 integrase catalytic region [Lacticaseibacillus nasuensis JCM 17158]